MEFDFYTRHFTRKYHKKKTGEFLWDLCKDYQVNAHFFQWNGQFANDKNAVFILCI